MTTDERTPINLYSLNLGYSNKGMTKEELIKDLRKDIHIWHFILVVDIIFTVVMVYMNIKVPSMTPASIIVYIVTLSLLIVSTVKIHRYHSQYRSIINEDV